jgi:class 3 adenylate cyclase/tetratricopeptide (TPR) repeat protein
MQCPKCQFQNPEETRFCGECGAKFEKICSSCNSPNPPRFKFCGECGQKLEVPAEGPQKELPLEEKIEKIQKYLPKGLIEKILSQREKIEGERKQVAVMFCDMVGFTALVDQLGAEAAYAIMDQVYEILIHMVHEYEGTVNEMTGDGIMALFGAPIALEDTAQRAIRSAYAIHREMTRFNDRLREDSKNLPPLKMRIGIHSGPVIVGTLGNDLRVEFKAVGDTVNLASRMEGLAEPGTIFVSGDTFELTEGLFRFEALGNKKVKGRDEPIAVYRVIAPRTRKTRFDVNAERGLTTFVGRDRELELVIDSLTRAKEGTGQAFSVIGEAGIGKSRFLYEFRKAVANEDITFLEGKCLSYGKGSPYHPIADILKGNFEIGEDDTDEVIREKVKRGLKTLQADETMTLPYLLELLSVKDSGIDGRHISPEGRKDRIIESVRQIVLKGAQIRPLVIAIEDLHWADKSTEDVLKWILDAVPGGRVLLLFTYRPEFVHTWGGRSYHNQITLNRLSNRESLLMVAHLLGTDAVEAQLEKHILSKTEGVPFFIEEFVKSLQGLDILKTDNGKARFTEDRQTNAIPSTIQDMIMARVDRLSDDTKAVLQASTAIEREFSHDLIRAVTVLPEEELLSHLSTLKDAELLYERGVYPQSVYIFRHALTREVVYASILTDRRRTLHHQIGTAIEAMYKEDLAEHYEILVEHFYQSEDYARAAMYAKLAAKKVTKSAALSDAIIQARIRVRCLEKMPDSEEWIKERIDARTVLGLYLNQMNYWVDARDAVAPVFEMTREKGYWKRLGQIQTILGCYYGFIDEDLPKAVEAIDEGLRIATEQNDFITMVLASYWSGIVESLNCDFKKTETSIQRAVDINTAGKSLWGISTQKAQLAYFCYYFQGETSALEALSSEALKIAQESGDIISRGIAHTVYGFACYCKGRLEEVQDHALEGKKLLERIDMPGWATNAWNCLARTYYAIEAYDQSRDCYDQCIRKYQKTNSFPSIMGSYQLGLALCEVILGQKDINLESLRNIQEKNRIKIVDGWNCNFLGEILMNLGGTHMNEAEQWIRKAIAANSKNGARFYLGLDHALYGEFYKKQENHVRAQEELGKAAAIMRACGADGWAEKYEKEVAEL